MSFHIEGDVTKCVFQMTDIHISSSSSNAEFNRYQIKVSDIPRFSKSMYQIQMFNFTCFNKTDCTLNMAASRDASY